MGLEENKAVVKQYIQEIMSNGDYTHAEELLDENFFGDQGTIKGIEAHKERFKAQGAAIPDGANNLQEMIAEGDKVVAISMLTWTDTAGIGGHPPTNKPAKQKVIVVYTLKDGKIVNGEPLGDSIGGARSVGHTSVNFG